MRHLGGVGSQSKSVRTKQPNGLLFCLFSSVLFGTAGLETVLNTGQLQGFTVNTVGIGGSMDYPPCLGAPHPGGPLPRTKDANAIQRQREIQTCVLARLLTN